MLPLGTGIHDCEKWVMLESQSTKSSLSIRLLRSTVILIVSKELFLKLNIASACKAEIPDIREMQRLVREV